MAAPATPRVSVVIPARDAEATLAATLRALEAQTVGRDAFELIVVDNGSLDGTVGLARGFDGVRVIERERGAGPGAARNDGAAAARGDVIAFTDSDCEPEPGWLAAGLAALGDDEADVVVGCVEPVRPPGPLDRTVHFAVDTGLFESANLFVRRARFERAGGFPAGLEPDGTAPFGEDVLFGWAAVRDGARVAFSPGVRVRHAVEPRGAGAFVAERRRLALFPPLVRQVPELRGTFLHRGVFLTERSARFDLAAAGLAAALAARRPWPLLALAPYAALVARDVRSGGRRAAAAKLAADAVGAVALVRGSVAARTPVL